MAIPYGRQTIDNDDVDAAVAVLRGDWLTTGPAVRAFEEAVMEACDVPYAVAYSSGTAALHGAAFAAGIGPGDELVTSAITFAASGNCAAYVGATPRFADIDPATWNVSVATVAAATSDRTRALIPVHFTGLPAPIRQLRAAHPDLVLIEDAAHAIGARQADEPVGACRHSDMAVLSFHPVKTVTSAEGGMVTTRDAECFRRLLEFRTHGMTRDPARLERDEGGWYMEQQALGYNYRLSDVHSALGVSQMRKLERFIERRNAIAARYRELLGDLEQIELAPEPPPGERHGRHLYVIRHRGGAAARRRLYDGLHDRGILVQVHYLPVYLHPWYRDTYGYQPGLCPAAEEYYAGCLSLPCYPALSDEQQDSVVEAVRELS
ncbi:MAG TPA: UDP-4-amino-4,6-dideoxy-N-acetyl-beta-L-altrosamine transaminase [Solirubrobacteraceae bacterium]|nr:UDP-4-amino-4,6-dideoxy-N-acetyl-beta-L-altrosamine transaminase [Solirubrobacteraceae bacterium]